MPAAGKPSSWRSSIKSRLANDRPPWPAIASSWPNTGRTWNAPGASQTPQQPTRFLRTAARADGCPNCEEYAHEPPQIETRRTPTAVLGTHSATGAGSLGIATTPVGFAAGVTNRPTHTWSTRSSKLPSGGADRAPVQFRANTIELHARVEGHRGSTREIEREASRRTGGTDFGEPCAASWRMSATSEPPLAARSSSVMLAEPEAASQPLQPVVPSLLQPSVSPSIASPIVWQPIVVLFVHVSEPISGMSSEMAPPASRPSRAVE